MPSLRTEITEITTGLAMLGYQDLARALEVRPRHITHVTEATFDRLDAAMSSGLYDRDFEVAWSNGSAFARSSLGLRGRPPWTLEWKGHHKPASKGIETIPADLRIDHVYLISCKYGSRILHNSGPVPLFEHGLAAPGPIQRTNWFETICPDAFRSIWEPAFSAAGLPSDVTPSTATTAQRSVVERHLELVPIDTRAADYADFVSAASVRTADRWRSRTSTPRARQELLWRLLRMQSAPYYVLGTRHDGAEMRYRVGTPWDFAQEYRLESMSITAGHRGQPSVDWNFDVVDRHGVRSSVHGHVEVRWSHGKLNGSPEAKVYLDCDPESVPGYDPL